jgi:indole-3-glycerol phosphate synthase
VSGLSDEGGQSVLERIVAGVAADLERRKAAILPRDLAEIAADAPAPPSFADALRRGTGPRVIAEVKKASPSRGPIAPSADAAAVARAYRDAGASAISVLTEERRFGGSLEDLSRARIAVEGRVPLLRKDFIVDSYQVHEARAAGASAVLLMVVLLGRDGLDELLESARDAGIDALVEVHDERELDVALAAGARVIGVNSRDLRTLEVDMKTHERLAAQLPADVVKVAESGIRTRADLDRLAALGYDACLVGERLMSENDPGRALAQLLGRPS